MFRTDLLLGGENCQNVNREKTLFNLSVYSFEPKSMESVLSGFKLSLLVDYTASRNKLAMDINWPSI